MKRYGFVFLALVLQLILLSCVSMQVLSDAYVEKRFVFSEKDTFYLEPITINSFNFFEEEEIGYIMNKKLAFALSRSQEVTLTKTEAKSGYLIVPELVIKVYEKKYDKRNYYLMVVRVLSRQRSVCQFNYEYNGTANIFDGKLQNAMIDKFLKDFTKQFRRASKNEP